MARVQINKPGKLAMAAAWFAGILILANHLQGLDLTDGSFPADRRTAHLGHADQSLPARLPAGRDRHKDLWLRGAGQTGMSARR